MDDLGSLPRNKIQFAFLNTKDIEDPSVAQTIRQTEKTGQCIGRLWKRDSSNPTYTKKLTLEPFFFTLLMWLSKGIITFWIEMGTDVVVLAFIYNNSEV